MATPNNMGLESLVIPPLLPDDRGDKAFHAGGQVMDVYYRPWMDKPELVPGIISDVVRYKRPERNGSIGFVNLYTPKNPNNPTGRILGVDMNNAGLIPEAAWPHLSEEEFLRAWVNQGTLGWPLNRAMLEDMLLSAVAEGGIGWQTADIEPHLDEQGLQHPTRAREHTQIVPGSHGGKVAELPPLDFDYSASF